MAMSEKKRLIFTLTAVSVVGIVTGLFLGGGLLPSQAAQQQYDEKTTTSRTELSIVHAHDGISQHAHPLITVVTITETTPHGIFHDFAATMAPGTPTPTASISRPGANKIWTINREFLPMTLTVPVGTNVTFVNKDNEEHTVTFNNGLFNMRLMNRDASFSYTFTERGTFEFYCEPHREMVGKVIVK